jgi:hypothetical protein
MSCLRYAVLVVDTGVSANSLIGEANRPLPRAQSRFFFPRDDLAQGSDCKLAR